MARKNAIRAIKQEADDRRLQLEQPDPYRDQ